MNTPFGLHLATSTFEIANHLFPDRKGSFGQQNGNCEQRHDGTKANRSDEDVFGDDLERHQRLRQFEISPAKRRPLHPSLKDSGLSQLLNHVIHSVLEFFAGEEGLNVEERLRVAAFFRNVNVVTIHDSLI